MRNSQGFTLLEVMIVVTILGIIAAIAMPSLIDALDRGHQTSTMADLRTIGGALERYAYDHHRYPVADELKELKGELVPKYVKKLPLKDGWDHPLVYEVDDQGSTYTLRSPGKDGVLQPEELTEETHDFAADIVYVDGVFVQRPAGEQE